MADDPFIEKSASTRLPILSRSGLGRSFRIRGGGRFIAPESQAPQGSRRFLPWLPANKAGKASQFDKLDGIQVLY